MLVITTHPDAPVFRYRSVNFEALHMVDHEIIAEVPEIPEALISEGTVQEIVFTEIGFVYDPFSLFWQTAATFTL